MGSEWALFYYPNLSLILNQSIFKLHVFEIVFAKDYFYDEFYASYEDFDLFLQSVPIFEDFDSEKDRKFLEKYVEKFGIEEGIRFPQHRVVIVAKKL